MNNRIGPSARAQGMALLAVVFVAGAVAGGAIDRVWVTRSTTTAAIVPTFDGAKGTRSASRNTSDPTLPLGSVQNARDANIEIPMSLRSVALSKPQRRKIVAIVARLRPGVDSIMQSLRPQVREIDLLMRQEAMCVLTQEQRDGWIAFRKREHLNVEEGNIMMKLVANHECPTEK